MEGIWVHSHPDAGFSRDLGEVNHVAEWDLLLKLNEIRRKDGLLESNTPRRSIMIKG